MLFIWNSNKPGGRVDLEWHPPNGKVTRPWRVAGGKLQPCLKVLVSLKAICQDHRDLKNSYVSHRRWCWDSIWYQYVMHSRKISLKLKFPLFYLKVPGPIASEFFQIVRDFGIKRKLIFFSLPLVNFTTEKCNV